MQGSTTAAPERSLEQRMQALAKGNRHRTHRKELKRDLKHGRGERDVRDVIFAPREEEETMKVVDLLLAMPKVGRVKANKMLSMVRASPSKTLGGLSDRQRADLLALMPRRR